MTGRIEKIVDRILGPPVLNIEEELEYWRTQGLITTITDEMLPSSLQGQIQPFQQFRQLTKEARAEIHRLQRIAKKGLIGRRLRGFK